MEAHELMIGNYVSDINASNRFYAEVKKLTETRCYYGLFNSSYNDLKPIPLTEQWLVKFGWSKGEYDTEYLDNTSLSQEVLGYNVNSKMFCIESNLDIIEIEHIQYVHQLQNLYFTLTGKQLKIK